jgi:hypothetical protein
MSPRNPNKRIKNRFTKEEAKKLIDEVFNYYGNPLKLTEEQFNKYFIEHKYMDENDAFMLRLEACWDYKLINYGIGSVEGEPVLQIWRPERPGELPIAELEETKEEEE